VAAPKSNRTQQQAQRQKRIVIEIELPWPPHDRVTPG
jgi:hypothetical protein